MYSTSQISKQKYLIPEEILKQTFQGLFDKIREELKPEEEISVSQWADRFRFLSPEDCEKAQMGDPKWTHDGFEYLAEFEDAFSDPIIRQITALKSAQTAFTAAMINQIFFAIDKGPGPILVLYPTEGNARKFSKRKLDPAIRDTPMIRQKVSDITKKDGDNSTLEKSFPDGFISLVSAATVNNLSSQSIRYLFIDEKDRIPLISAEEGDTVEIVAKRLQGFKNTCKQVNISTPTNKRTSRITADYEKSDQRKRYVPCPQCNHYQVLSFWQLKGWRIDKGVYEPENTYYECENCKAHLTEMDKYWMKARGVWRKTRPEVTDHAGFHINELYSPLSTWEDIVRQFIKKKDNPASLQTFFNLELGEPFEDVETEAPSENILVNRREEYDGNSIPEGAYVLTASCDIQKDRIELLVKAWGKGDESWLVDYQKFYGNPQTLYTESADNIWYNLETHLSTIYTSVTGVRLRIGCCGIDARFSTRFVLKFVQKMNSKGKGWIFALQGDQGLNGAPLLSRPTYKNNKIRVKQFTIGTSTAKTVIFARLKIEDYGPGYMHFNMLCDEEYFRQLTAEKEVPVYEKGVLKRKQWIKTRARNEALDLEVYALAGLDYLNIQNWNAVEQSFKAAVEKVTKSKDKPADSKKPQLPEETKRKSTTTVKRKKNFVTDY